MTTDSYVFIGPTISRQEAARLLQATYLPPVSQGDIISLLRKRPRVIGIIDGYFERVPAVWHKEILLAMSKGVHVIGGASMGALRAAELYRFGMVGVGEIFEWYRDGIIEADDEVAVRHMPADYNYRPTSEAMVNIRKVLQVACSRTIISLPTRDSLVEIGRRIHYSRRIYRDLLRRATLEGLPKDEVAALEGFLAENPIDLKKRDAVKVLQYIAALEDEVQPLEVDYNLNITNVFVKLMDKDFCLATVDGVRLTADMLVNHTRLERADFLALQERALQNAHLLALADQEGVTISGDERQETLNYLRQSFNLEDESDLAGWKSNNHLSTVEFEAFIKDWAYIRKMARRAVDERETAVAAQTAPSPRLTNQQIIRQLRIEGIYETMVRSAAIKEKYFLEQPHFIGTLVDGEQLYKYFFRQKQMEMPEDVNVYAAQLGFSDEDVFKVELIKYYYYHRHRREAFRAWFQNLETQAPESAEDNRQSDKVTKLRHDE